MCKHYPALGVNLFLSGFCVYPCFYDTVIKGFNFTCVLRSVCYRVPLNLKLKLSHAKTAESRGIMFTFRIGIFSVTVYDSCLLRNISFIAEWEEFITPMLYVSFTILSFVLEIESYMHHSIGKCLPLSTVCIIEYNKQKYIKNLGGPM